MQMTEKESRALDHLASMPTIAHAIVATKELRNILEATDGDIMANGRLYEIDARARGAGMYTIRLKETA